MLVAQPTDEGRQRSRGAVTVSPGNGMAGALGTQCWGRVARGISGRQLLAYADEDEASWRVYARAADRVGVGLPWEVRVVDWWEV
jgi:hypothetical protein